jgi:hypothetical protein
VTAGIDHVEEDAIALRDGRRLAVDAIVLATGFDSTSFLAPMTVRHRQAIAARRMAGPRAAYLGLTVAGFPNFFMMSAEHEPGHNSIIFMIECQTHPDCLRQMDARNSHDRRRRDVLDAYNAAPSASSPAPWPRPRRAVQDRRRDDHEQLVISTWRYWLKTRIGPACYDVAARTARGRPARAGGGMTARRNRRDAPRTHPKAGRRCRRPSRRTPAEVAARPRTGSSPSSWWAARASPPRSCAPSARR